MGVTARGGGGGHLSADNGAYSQTPVLPLNCQHQMVETTLLHCMQCA